MALAETLPYIGLRAPDLPYIGLLPPDFASDILVRVSSERTTPNEEPAVGEKL